MTYVTHGIGPLFVCRWQRPELADLDSLLAEAKTYRDRVGEPLIYVGVTDDESEPPDPAFRREILSRMPELIELCSDYYLVAAETGFKAGVMRAIMAGLFLAWRRSGVVRVMASMDDVLVREHARLPLSPEATAAELRAHGALGD